MAERILSAGSIPPDNFSQFKPRPPRTSLEKQLGISSLSKDMVIVLPNGIDLTYVPFYRQDGKGHAYEDVCFSTILKNSDPSSMSLGPRLVDFLFRARQISNAIRPDTITFDKEDDAWTLTHLYEFKLSRTDTSRKLKGFSDLLLFFRNDLSYLKKLITLALANCIRTPSQINIPEDKLVTVTFIKPFPGEPQFLRKKSEIQVERLTISFDRNQ